MNQPKDAPVEDIDPPASPEELAEVRRRLVPGVHEEQRKAARPAAEVMADLRRKHGLAPR